MLSSLRSRVWLLSILALSACGDDASTEDAPEEDGGQDAGDHAEDGAVPDGGAPDAGPECDSAGKPEMTGPIVGLQASYQAGDPIEVSVPVDEDTERVIVGVYEEGSLLYLGGTAEEVESSDSVQLSLFAGVADGPTGTFYLSVELCSTSVCTTPFVRNTYQRADRLVPFESGETYEQTRENVGGDVDLTEVCPTSIPIQSFEIE